MHATITGESGKIFELEGQEVDVTKPVDLNPGLYLITDEQLKVMGIYKVFSTTPLIQPKGRERFAFRIQEVRESEYETIERDLEVARWVELIR